MGLHLDKSDLIRHESILKDFLSSLFRFTSYSLYFPREIPRGMKQGQKIIPMIEKDRVLLPLVLDDRFLGVFLARGISSRQMKPLKDHLTAFISLGLDRIILYKKSMLDRLSGLYNHERFNELIQNEIEAVLSSIIPGPETAMDNGSAQHSASFCVMFLNLDRFRTINETFGFAFGDMILAETGTVIREAAPDQAAAARLYNDNFALFLPHTSQKKCLDLAGSILKKIADLVFEYQVSGEKISLTASAGLSFFPQDIKGPQFSRTRNELSRIVLEKARQAMEMAKENGRNRLYSFGRLIFQGGVVMECLPMNRLIINLGKNVDVMEGSKFMVWSGKYNGHSQVLRKPEKTAIGSYPPLHKGEITILDVQDRISIAEVIYLNDPAWRMEPGDRLSPISDKDSLLEKEALAGNEARLKDTLTGLYSYGDFISLWSRARENSGSFCMAMIRVKGLSMDRSDQGISGENLVLEVVKSLKKNLSLDPLGGRYSSTCLIFYLPHHNARDLKTLLTHLSSQVKSRHEALIHCGISAFPCLNFSRMDTLENCRKALEHADLTQFPHVACFDSISLTISADRLFAQGDNFSAMEEYKMALAADETNFLARNSLAICYARLGRLEMAKKQFQEITAREENNLMAWYNLACVCLKQGEVNEAEKAFHKCLNIEPGHAFSLFRMGQLAEKNNDLDKAAESYIQASQTRDGQVLAPRHLARLAWKRGRKEEARELLHQALINNPRDAFSLNLMARLYIEAGDDPAIAETLARQSVNLRPDVPGFWLDLTEILKAQGKDEQAVQAGARAVG